jgi:adenosylmethionine-8-amino-7-oxononanoate aminotransferase
MAFKIRNVLQKQKKNKKTTHNIVTISTSKHGSETRAQRWGGTNEDYRSLMSKRIVRKFRSPAKYRNQNIINVSNITRETPDYQRAVAMST